MEPKTDYGSFAFVQYLAETKTAAENNKTIIFDKPAEHNIFLCF